MSSPVNCFVLMCSDCVALQVGNVFLSSLLKHSGASLFNHFYNFLDSFVHTVFPDIFVKPIHFFQLLKSLLDFIYVNQATPDCIAFFCWLSIYNDVQLRLTRDTLLSTSSNVSSVFSKGEGIKYVKPSASCTWDLWLYTYLTEQRSDMPLPAE